MRENIDSMYHSAVMPLIPSGTLPVLKEEEDLQLNDESETLVANLHGTNTKSLLLSPLTFTRAFSPATLALLQVGGGGDSTVSPLLPHNTTTQSHGNTRPQDFTCHLPVEIMVYILLYLEPQDLCR